ncbi:MAG: tetratricopeptide repeat protein [bacterium]|nr:tetratricopeptide repeat protein [bacterium]
MSAKNILLISVFLFGIFWSFHFFGRWRVEESYNSALAGKAMPDKDAMENLDRESLFLKGFLKEEKGNLDGAEEDYLLLVSKSEGLHKQALFNLANVYIKKAVKMNDPKMLDVAIEYYKAALRIDSNFLEAKYNLDLAMRLLTNASGESAQQDEGKGSGEKGTIIPFKPGNI